MQIDTHITGIIDNIIIENDIIDVVIITITSLSTLLSSTVVHQKQSFLASYDVRVLSHYVLSDVASYVGQSFLEFAQLNLLLTSSKE